MIRIGTLFSGGLAAPEQALKQMGLEHETVFACEIDRHARKNYLANHGEPTCGFFSDVRYMHSKTYYEVEKDAGRLDIIVWGFPCQDYSLSGKRAGIEGQRGTLFYDGAKIIDKMRPKYFIAENVKGLLSSNGGKDFAVILDILRNMGYYVHYDVLNSKDYGTPQNRERVFLVGFLDHNEYLKFDFAEPRPLTKKLKNILESEVEDKYYLSDKALKGFITHSERHTKAGNGFKFKPTDGEGCANALTTRSGGRSTDTYIIDDQGRKEKQKDPKLLTICPTLRTQIGNMPRVVRIAAMRGRGNPLKWNFNKTEITNAGIRRLTPRECFRLQSCDDSFKIVVSDTQAYKIAGNAIDVGVMTMILKQLFDKQPTGTLMDFA